MSWHRESKAFSACCILFFTLTTGQHIETRFSKEPPSKIVAIKGSDVKFHWKFSFADSEDRSRFEQIVWGRTDNNPKIRDKYITVYSDGKASYNVQLPESKRSRLAVTGNITLNGTNHVFVLKAVTPSDAEITYGCTATVYGEWIRSGPVMLDIQVPPSITIRTNGLNVTKGEDVELQCDADGKPKPLVEWSKDGVLKQSKGEKTSLLISKVDFEDEGTYICKAINPVGSVSYSVRVTVNT